LILQTAFLRGFSAHNLRGQISTHPGKKARGDQPPRSAQEKDGYVDPDVLEQAVNETVRKSMKKA